MLNNAFKQLTNQFSVEVYLNREVEARRALITSKASSASFKEYDDRVIHSTFPIKRGDYINYQGVDYIIMSDIQADKGYKYKATMRPATNLLPVIVEEAKEIIIDWDRLGRPIFETIPEVRENIPCIAFQETLSISGQAIVVKSAEIKIIVGDNDITQKVKVNDVHKLHDERYVIMDIDLFEKGLRIFSMELTHSRD